jgi:hypothetical protein
MAGGVAVVAGDVPVLGRVGLTVELRRRAGPEREPRRIRRLDLLPDTLLERLQSRFAEEDLRAVPGLRPLPDAC